MPTFGGAVKRSLLHGAEEVRVLDMNGDLVAQQSASSMSADGTTLTFATPNFTELTEGVYAGVVSNINSDGSYQYIGTTSVNVPHPFYRPTSYSDASTNDPRDYTPVENPSGPITGTNTLGYSTADVQAFTYFGADQNGNLFETGAQSGLCTWSGFPSHVDTNALTLYVPYSITVGGPSDNGSLVTVTATINGTTTTLYNKFAYSGIGVATATIPAGTNLSTLQVTVSSQPQNNDPGGGAGAIEDDFQFDIYVQ